MKISEFMKFYLDCLGIRQSAQGWEAMQQRYLSGTGELSGRLGVRRVEGNFFFTEKAHE